MTTANLRFCKDGLGLAPSLPADVICELASIIRVFGMQIMKYGSLTSKDSCIISLTLGDLEINILLNSQVRGKIFLGPKMLL